MSTPMQRIPIDIPEKHKISSESSQASEANFNPNKRHKIAIRTYTIVNKGVGKQQFRIKYPIPIDRASIAKNGPQKAKWHINLSLIFSFVTLVTATMTHITANAIYNHISEKEIRFARVNTIPSIIIVGIRKPKGMVKAMDFFLLSFFSRAAASSRALFSSSRLRFSSSYCCSLSHFSFHFFSFLLRFCSSYSRTFFAKN